jgi:hypothetical protein
VNRDEGNGFHFDEHEHCMALGILWTLGDQDE